MYLVLGRFDAEPFVILQSKEDLLKALDDGYYDDCIFIDSPNIGLDRWPAYTIFVFKGLAVIPHAVEVVRRYEL
jgi:hypothetical protein